MSKKLPTSYIVVTLLGLSVHGEFVPAETTLEVDRALRNDWIGSKLARDATDEEVAAYRAEQGDDDLEDLEALRATLERTIADLEKQHASLVDQVQADLDKRSALIGEIGNLEKQRDDLTAEVAALEKAKAAAAEPTATDAKAGKK